MKYTKTLFFALLVFIASTGALSAQDEPVQTKLAGDEVTVESDSPQVPNVTSETWQSFEALFDVINQSKKDLAKLRTRLGRAKDDTEREESRSSQASAGCCGRKPCRERRDTARRRG